MSWKRKIVNTFVNHYFASAPKNSEDRNTLRIRSSLFFPNFDAAHPDEKEAYLTAAENLERRGIAKLNWEKGQKGERLKTICCDDFKKLFREAGKPYPQAEAERTRAMLRERKRVKSRRIKAKLRTKIRIREKIKKEV